MYSLISFVFAILEVVAALASLELINSISPLNDACIYNTYNALDRPFQLSRIICH